MSDDQYTRADIIDNLGRLEEKSENLANSIVEIKRFLMGNGQKGILERLATIEEKSIQAAMTSKETSETVAELAKAIGDLKDIVKIHVQDERIHSLRGLILRKDILIYLVLAFVFIHTLIEDGGLAFEAFKHLLGM